MSINRSQLEARFREEYDRLNPRQREAVDRIEGPVMVIAGPGTGKTQILASRIGRILLDTDTHPENILCLTFTEAGVLAMRRRLLQFIGPDAYKVNIYTFHAFCNEVIQDNLSLFEKTALDPISDLEKIELFKELIDSFPKNHPLKRYRGDVYFEINNLQHLFSTMKQEGWTPAFINKKIDEYLESVFTRDEFYYKKKSGNNKAGDIKQHLVDEVKDQMTRLRAAVNEFENFQQLMRRRNRYDFDDMINWVIRAFTENKNLLLRYQEQFLYILVDEYQDTSGTQNKLVEMLISYWEEPNVFVVGDDDQSIYRFQGANIENMKQFADSYQASLLTVVLTQNYRSTQPILDVSKTIIGRNQERLVNKLPNLSKDLQSSHPEIMKLDHPPCITELETEREEMAWIVKEVEKLVKKNIHPGEIAVIYKENRYGEELARYFKQVNIPYYSKRNLNLFEQPLARKIIQIIKYLAAEHDIPYGGDEMLFEILHYDFFEIAPIEIARLSVELATSRDNQLSIRRLIHDKSTQPAPDLFNTHLSEQLRQAGKAMEALIAAVPNQTLQQVFESIIRKTGLLDSVMKSADKHAQLRIIGGLFDFIREETHRRPDMRIQELVDLFNLMEKEELILPLVEVNGSERGVNLLTAHGSKGLEFDYVYVAGSVAGLWEKKRRPGRGYKLPDNLFATSSGDGDKEEKEEELRRLFYVALTRARRNLYISYYRFRADGKEVEPSRFIAEINDEYPLEKQSIKLSEEELSRFTILQFSEVEAPSIQKMEEEFIGRLLESFTMNVTALNNYLSCPLEFYFQNLLRIPSPKNEATEFGSAVHYALEQLFRKMQEHPKQEFHGMEQFLQDFEWWMKRHRESFTPEQYNRRLEYGQQILPAYYESHIHKFNKIVAIERNIRVVWQGIPLRGKLDKLEFDGKSVNVVDYKTGDPKNAADKLKPPGDKIPLGGNYWRQAVFYKILVDNYENKGWKVVSSEFDFIEPDSKKKEYVQTRVIITPEDVETVSGQVNQTWEKIQNREFYTGCGEADCHWCQFVRSNKLLSS